MSAIDDLIAAQRRAYQEWVATPDRPKAAKEAAATQLAAAASAVAAAKTAAKPAEAKVDIDAAFAACAAQRAGAARDRASEQAILDADALYEEAASWPRCLDAWPASEAEVAADALLKQHGILEQA